MFSYSLLLEKNPYLYMSPFEFGYCTIVLYRALLIKEIKYSLKMATTNELLILTYALQLSQLTNIKESVLFDVSILL